MQNTFDEKAGDEKPFAKNRFLQRFFVEPFQKAEQQSRDFLRNSSTFDAKTAIVLTTAAITLTVEHFVFSLGDPPEWFNEILVRWFGNRSDQAEFTGNLYFILGMAITYLFVPLLVVKCVLKESLAEYGLKRKGAFQGGWTYFAMLMVMFSIVLFMSRTAEFQETYPFYRPPAGEPLYPRFFVWEVSYVFQFFALEFLFRGFMVHGTKHRFGFYSIFVMMIPYCMIHFAKPMPECFGAIIAGIILGFMSLKTCSIWGGFAVHIGVALSMDFLVLYHQGLLG